MAVLKIKKNGEWVRVGIGAQGPRGPAGPAGSGAGDMMESTYDPQGKAQDIYAYADNAAKNVNASSVKFSDGQTWQQKYDAGEFKGQDGEDGSNGKDGVSATHAWNGTTLTVTSASGTSSADLKGDKGDPGYTPQKNVDYFDGQNGKDGSNGKDGTSVTVASVSESAADGGTNVVTFSDGKKLNVKNGSKGSDGAPGYTPQKGVDYFDGAKGEPGYTPQKGTDYWTAADKAEMVADVLAALPAAEGGSY